MSANPIPTLSKLKNFNHILKNPYFGQIQKYKDNWQKLTGTTYTIVHPDIKVPANAEFVGFFLLAADELMQVIDNMHYSDFCPPTTIRQLCGLDLDALEVVYKEMPFIHSEAFGIYVFKNCIHD